jgi:hypothetical protein
VGQSDLFVDRPFSRPDLPLHYVEERAPQDCPEPGDKLLLGRAAEIIKMLAGPQESFLHHVGGTDAGPEPPMELHARQGLQVTAVKLQKRPEAVALARARLGQQPLRL